MSMSFSVLGDGSTLPNMGPLYRMLARLSARLHRRSSSLSNPDEITQEAFGSISSYIVMTQADMPLSRRSASLTQEIDDSSLELEFDQIVDVLDQAVGVQNREVYVLHGLGRTHLEIASGYNISREAVEANIARALAVLTLHRTCRV